MKKKMTGRRKAAAGILLSAAAAAACLILLFSGKKGTQIPEDEAASLPPAVTERALPESTESEVRESVRREKRTPGEGKEIRTVAEPPVPPEAAEENITENGEESGETAAESAPDRQPAAESAPDDQSVAETVPDGPYREGNSREIVPSGTPDPGNTEGGHTHEWQAVTDVIHHDAEIRYIDHEGVFETVHHDAETHEEPVYEARAVCSNCGEDITDDISGHLFGSSPECTSYTVQMVETGTLTVVDREAYDEEVCVREPYRETVTVREPYDETVIIGYRCPVCGEEKP